METTRARALDAAGSSEVNAVDNDVYLISAKGDFTAYHAAVPRGAQDPTGTVIFAVVDAETGEVLDWGLRQSPVPLGDAGDPEPLP